MLIRWQAWTEVDYATMHALNLDPLSKKPPLYDGEPYKPKLTKKERNAKDKELLGLAEVRKLSLGLMISIF